MQAIKTANLASSSILIKPILADIAGTVIAACEAVTGTIDAKLAGLIEEILIHAGHTGSL